MKRVEGHSQLHAARVLAVLLALVLQSCASAGGAAGPTAEEVPGRGRARPFGQKIPASAGLIVVPESDAELTGLASALGAKLIRDGVFPLLVVVDRSRSGFRAGLPLEPSAPCVLLTRDSDDRELSGLLLAKSTFTVQLPREGAAAGLELAKQAWGSSDTAVLASSDDPGAQILAAGLAARLGAPYLPVRDRSEAKRLTTGFGQLGVKRVLIAVHAARRPPPWVQVVRPEPQILDQGKVSELMVEKMGREKVRNVILARAPERRGKGYAYGSAWVAPYLGLVRDSLIVIRDDRSGTEAERAVLRLIASLGIRPRSVTILGDHEAIEDIAPRGDSRLNGYDLRIEPCSGVPKKGAAGLAVGRIPCSTLSRASLLVAAGLARERRFSKTPPRVLMVANPATGHTALPLCETVARFNSEDLKNRGVHVDEFYGKPSNDPPAVAASQKAHFIFFQGHVSDQNLFDRGWDLWNGGGFARADASGSEYTTGTPSGTSSLSRRSSEDLLAPAWLTITGNRGPDVESSRPEKVAQQAKLAGAPVVFLQSCGSLDPVLAQSVFDTGAVGLIGSVTSIHSASGSAFAKALSDGLTYRDSTVGEALRDARNYFLCLGELKRRRGHKEQAKVYRVGLSFRLWGDPELRLNLAQGRPEGGAKRSIRAAFKGADSLVLRVPRRRLPEVTAGKYRARMFAGSQAAGIVKTAKNKGTRRVLGMYFFRLEQPKQFAARGFGSLGGPRGEGARSVFLADPFERFVYVLYFPAKEKADEEIALQFRKGD